jgi:hypothetical protein
MICSLALQGTADEARAAYGANKAGCEVTKPQLTTLPGFTNEGYYLAQDGLFTNAGRKTTYAGLAADVRHPPSGTYPLHLRRDGSIKGKVPWYRDSSANGELRVRGIRRPGRDRMRGRYDNHLGPESEVIPGAMVFPRAGCWHITGTSGEATLKATVWVVRIR